MSTNVDEKLRAWEEAHGYRMARQQATDLGHKSNVIELTYEEAGGVPQVQPERQCRRMGSDGKVCGAPAVEPWGECLRHVRWYHLIPVPFALPYPEDAMAVQEFVARCVSLIFIKKLSVEEARAVAELCKLLEKNVGRLEGRWRK